MAGFQAHSDEAVGAAGVRIADYCTHVEAALLAEMRGELTAVPKRTLHRSGVYASSCHASWWTRGVVFYHNLFGADTARPGKAGPAYKSVQLVVDEVTLEPVLALSGSVVSTMVPVAVSCLAAQRLASPQSSVLGLIGAGLQARLHLSALKSLFPLERVLLHSRSQASCATLIAHANALGIDARAASPEETVAGSDIVVSSISESLGIRPFLSFNWLRQGTFVSSVDLLRPWAAHASGTRRFLVADDPSQVTSLADEGRMPACGVIDASLAQVLSGSVSVPAGPRAIVHPGCPSTLFGTTEAIRAALTARQV